MARALRIISQTGGLKLSRVTVTVVASQGLPFADADWGVLNRGGHWRHLANTTKPSVCGDDAVKLLSNLLRNLSRRTVNY